MANPNTQANPIAPWKMLVYITADNTLYQDAQINLRQLTEASSSNNVEIIVQLDGPTPDHVSRYECVGGNKKLLWEAPNDYTIDRAERLRNFLYSPEAAPKVWTGTPPEATTPPEKATPLERQRIALILWGHAAGLDHLYFYKEPEQTPGAPKGLQIPTFDDPNLYVTNIQLKTIFENYSKGVRAGIHEQHSTEVDFKIDLLGFDSCLMAMSEICHEVAGSVSILVASDEVVPNSSWPYDTILSDLNKFPGMDASTLSASIINRFREKYTQKGNKTRVSLSSMNLSNSNNLVNKMELLVKALAAATNLKLEKDVGTDQEKYGTAYQETDANGQAKRKIFRARDASRTPDEITYIDFGVFCKELSESFPEDSEVHTLASAVRDCLLKSPSPYIVYHLDAGEDGSIDPYGLAIYFPPTLDRITSQINDILRPALLPRDDVKTPGGPKGSKTPGGPRGSKSTDKPQITAYEILWHNYHKLDFNKETRWAELIYRLLGGKSTEYCSHINCFEYHSDENCLIRITKSKPAPEPVST